MKPERKKSKKSTYKDYLKQEMNGLIEAITLTELQKRFMKGRWLDQLLWLEGRATKSRDRYYLLRLLTIIGGVIVPALVSVNSINANGREARLREIFGWTAFALSQVVAISAAVEELFHYGESYRRYRNSAEGMKIEGWQFFQLSGPYSGAKDHNDAYATFAANIENIIQKDVEGYVSQTSQTEVQLKEKTQATIERNIALADKHLQEQLRQPPPPPPSRPQFPNRIQPGYNPSTPPGMPEEGEDEFLTPAQLQNQRVGPPGSPGRFPSTSAPFGSAPINSNPAPGLALEEDEDDFVSPAQIGGMPGKFNLTTPSPNSATISFNSVTVAALEEDDDDFVTPAQIGSVQIGTNGNKGAVTPLPPTMPPPPLPPPVAKPAPPPPPPLATPEVVAEILECPLKETQTYLPGVLEALQEKGILDKPTLIAAIATIGVETGGFCPINEYGGDSYFTEMYEDRDDLGNCKPGDGARYHGRGFIQITGRANYRDYGQKLGLGNALEDNPELALDAKVGAKILACYFYDREIDRAAQEGDWRLVRKLVNGGYNGWDEFENFVQRALQRL